ncbi:flagellar hook-associated protein FlgK [Candidatus Trichorickettsia mobilis]|uniref:Flagellar hook-associated protein 1 n=1 Tax=Candidatus Trichorickettsia mobilis TaxID=1346319 RepID=A0ABZ0USR6_9RICK|nr:hypothetical protein [Candidatus Trichorickettsia mobilis]WPY01070.1 flagellar hook-associated protein FlgK [Candidatus Trichorickettsia mobilis]
MKVNYASLTEAKKALGDIADNIQRANVPQSSGIDPHFVEDVRGNVSRIESISIRRGDIQIAKALRSSITQVSGVGVIERSLQSLQQALGDPSDQSKSSLVMAVVNFTSSAKSLAANQDPSIKQFFVTNSIKLADTISDITTKIDALRYDADQNLQGSIQEANQIIRDLKVLNEQISISGSIRLFDQRDRLLNQLATHFDIRVRFGNRGEALVSSTNGGATILDQTGGYAQLSYAGLLSQEAMIGGASLNPVNLDWYNRDNQKISSTEVINSNSLMASQIAGGAISANIKLRDQILPDSKETLTALTKTIADRVNKMHNSGSPFPPKTKFTSNKLVSLSQIGSWGGGIKVAVVGSQGEEVEGSSGPIRDIEINLEKLPSLNGNGKPKVADIVKELNESLNSGISSNRLSIGEVFDQQPVGVAIPNQYLVNDIKLVGRSNIDNAGINAGILTFDFEIDGSQYSGSKVEILGVAVSGGGALVSQLPEAFNLAKGTHIRTNQPITVRGINAAHDIDVQIRVIGDNGVVREGTARFSVNAANPNMINQRVVGTPQAGNMHQAPPPGLITHLPIATARLVKADGSRINDDDVYTEGYLQIETTSKELALIIDSSDSKDLGFNTESATDRGFGHFFGFNDYFNWNEKSGELEVNPEIATDVNKISMGKVSLGGRVDIIKVGDTRATMDMLFAGNPAPGDTVTIAGQLFTFRAAGPLAANEVLIGGGLPATMANLANTITATNGLLVDAVSNGLDTITLAAKNPGLSGNNIQVAVNMGGGTNVTLTDGAAVVTGPLAIIPATILGGGTDKNANVTINSSRIGNASTQVVQLLSDLDKKMITVEGTKLVPTFSATLNGVTTIIASSLAGQLGTAKNDLKVAENVLETMTKLRNDNSGIDKQTEYLKTLDLQDLLNAITATIRITNDINKMIINSIAAAAA